MSNSVAPLPTGTGVTVIGERRPRQEPEEREDGRHPAAGEHPPGHGGGDRSRHDAPPPPIEDDIVPPETLFATTLMANQLLDRRPSPDELRLRAEHEWAPPESPLRLKDRLV